MLVFVVCCPTAPEAQKEGQVDGRSWGLAGCSRRCADHCASRGWEGATCWLRAERTSLVSGAWAVLRGVVRKQLAGTFDQEAETKSVLRGAASSARSSKESSVRYVPGDQQEGVLPPRRRSGRRRRKRALPPLKCYPRGNRGALGSAKSRKSVLKKKSIEESRGARLQKAASRQDDAIPQLIRVATQSVPCSSAY